MNTTTARGGRQALGVGDIGTIRTEKYDSDGKKMGKDDDRRAAYHVAIAYYGAGDGTRKRKKARGTSADKAKKALRAAVAEAVARELEAQQDRDRGRTVPRDWDGFVALHLEYIETADYAPGTRRIYRDAIRNHMQGKDHPFHGRRLDSLTRGDMGLWLRGVADDHGNGAAKTTKAVALTMLSRADDWEIITRNPLHGLKTPKRSRETAARKLAERQARAEEKGVAYREADRGRSLGADDWDRIVAHLERPLEEGTRGPGRPRTQGRDLLDLLTFMYNEGSRIGETLGLLWEDVHEEDDEPHVTFRWQVKRVAREIPNSEHKTEVRLLPLKTEDSERTVFVTEETAALLRRRRAEDESQGGTERPNRVGTAFPSSTGTLWEERAASRQMRAVFDHPDVGVPWASSHTMRHTVVTESVAAGVPLHEVTSKVGHAEAETTLGYLDTKTASKTAGTKLSEHRTKRSKGAAGEAK